MSLPLEYRAEIDGVRAVAVLPVIFYHAGFDWFSGGFVGVDVFFVISGFLITSQILDDLRNGRFTYARFIERRARRILPALFVVLASCIPLAWLVLMPDAMIAFGKSVAATALFVSNIHFWREIGYFDLDVTLKPLIHTWSLSIEEQYYLAFPMLLVLLVRWRPAAAGLGIALLALVSFLLSEWTVLNRPSAGFYLLPFRGWELLAGAFVATLSRSAPADSRLPRWWREALGIAGVAMVVIPVFAYSDRVPFPGAAALAPVAGTTLLLVFAKTGSIVHRCLSFRPLVGVGLVSYGLYLWHQPLLAFARAWSPGALHWTAMTVVLVGSVCLAFLSWKFVETPIRKGRRVPRKAVAIGAVTGMVACTAFGLASASSGGFLDQRTTAAQRATLATASPSPDRVRCHAGAENPILPDRACESLPGASSWAVLGDSHAVELAFALGGRLGSLRVGVQEFSHTNCSPSFAAQDAADACARWTATVVDHILRSQALHTVVVSYRVNRYLYGDQLRAWPEQVDVVGDAERSRVWQAYVRIVNTLVAGGKRVVLVLQAPELPRDVRELVFRGQLSGADIRGVPRIWWEKRNAFVGAHLGEFATAVEVIDPSRLFCAPDWCLAARAGVALYFDDNHPSITGAGIIADAILARTPVNGS